MEERVFRPTASLVMEVGGRIFYPDPDDSPSSRALFDMLERELEAFLRDCGA